MGAPTLGATRWARAAAYGVATLAMAIGAHVSAGGALPSMTVLAALALPVTMAAVILTGRRCGLLLMLGSMTGAQLLLHHTLMAVTSHGPAALSGQAASARAMSGNAIAHTTQAMTQTMASSDAWSTTMTTTHVVATVIMALLLALSEQAVWQLVSKHLPTLPSEPILVGCPPLHTLTLLSIPAWAPSEMSGGLGLRGPPARCRVAA